MSRTLLKSLPKISPVLDRRNTAYNRCSTCSSCMSVSEKFGLRILVSKVFKFLDIVSLYRDIHHHVQDCSMLCWHGCKGRYQYGDPKGLRVTRLPKEVGISPGWNRIKRRQKLKPFSLLPVFPCSI